MADLPTGTVTLLFTDIEGSTKLLHELGERYADVLAEHRRVLREAFRRHGGVEVDTQGDAFFYAFEKAADAVAAADEAQRGLSAGPVAVRIGVHTGEPLVTEEGYVGIDVHRAARIMSACHGGQVVVSERTRGALANGDSNSLLLADLGLHRLKDLGQPEKLYQLGDGEFPPLKTLDATNLPVASSPLLGRERELDELLDLLQEGTRVLTVTGPGGTGKTRLALQVAAELVGSYADGVFWVPLGGLSDPELVLPTIAQTIGAGDDLQEHLRGRELLLLLDNLEHLPAAAPAVGELSSSAERLRVLVTSRAPLHLRGEREYVLEPLPPGDAVTLFCERARAVGRELAPDGTIDAICRRLDGLPLAIELAAARAKLLRPEALLERLDKALPLLTGGARDAPERQQTLRATIQWSHDLLSPEQQKLFRRLAVFAGGFGLDAAEEIAQADLDGLAALVDLSLLKPVGEERFLMLETVREYAAERLEESRPDDVHERHAIHYLALAEFAEAEFNGPEQAVWFERLERDRGNLRAALDWAKAAGAVETELRLATALREFWNARGPIAEALTRLEGAVHRAGDALPDRRLEALRAATLSALRVGDHDAADRLAHEFRELSRALGDREGEVSALIKLGAVAAGSGRFEQGRSLMEQAVDVARESGDARTLGHALLNCGAFALAEGDAERAAHLCELSLAEGGAELDARGRSVALLNLAFARLQLGEAGRAEESAREALEVALVGGDRSSVADALGVLAAATAAEDAARAARLLGAAAALTEEIGGELDDELVSAVRAAAGDDDTYELAYAEGRAFSLDDAVELAVARE
jgi:predicted ATPase/class 3 adenylate cyclase